jgi:oligopeptide transport system substrate-binding protein
VLTDRRTTSILEKLYYDQKGSLGMRHHTRRASVTAVLAAVTAVALTACSFGGSSGSKKGEKSLRMEYSNFPIIDPQSVTYGEWLSASALFEGVVRLNKDGSNVEPAAATSWDVSPDKKTYTFHLRDEKWSDGSTVTADDFVWTYKRLLTPSNTSAGATQGANSYVPGLGIKNAVAYQGGAIKDWSQVGIKAPDEKTLVITLAAPNSDFLLGMTHPSMLVLPSKVVQKYPSDWQKPAHFVGNGAYVLKGWTVNASMQLDKNPNYWNAKNVDVDHVSLALTDDPTQAGLHFENNETDIAALLSADIPRYQKSASLKKQLILFPSFYRSYLAVMHSKNPALEDVRVREAFSLALGRENVAKSCNGCNASYSLVPSNLPGAGAAAVTEDIPKAKSLLADAGYPNGKGLPTVHILVTQDDPTAEATIDNWKTNLGVNAKLDVVDPGSYVQKRAAVQGSNYIGFYGGAFANLPSWRGWVSTLWGATFTESFSLNSANWARYNSLIGSGKAQQAQQLLDTAASPDARRFAQTVTAADTNGDAAAGNKQYAEAAAVRQKTYLFLPTLTNDAYYAVRSGIGGVGQHPGYLLPFYLGDLTKS